MSPDCRSALLSRHQAWGQPNLFSGSGQVTARAVGGRKWSCWRHVKLLGARTWEVTRSVKRAPSGAFARCFISDVHLGARGSQADRLLDFLRSHDADTIYLVGDIVDGWALKSSWYWPQSHNDFVQKLLRKARKGAKIIYVPGNHDEFLRNYYGTHFGGIDVVENFVHTGADGRRYLVIHGDIFDLVVQNARWLAHLGDKAYDFAIQMNRLVNFFRALVRRALLVAVAMGQAEGQERGQLYRRLRGSAGRRSAAPRRRRRDLRPHPLRHHPRRARHPLHELRRLGRKLHRARRARRRPLRDHHLDRSAAPAPVPRRSRVAARAA